MYKLNEIVPIQLGSEKSTSEKTKPAVNSKPVKMDADSSK